MLKEKPINNIALILLVVASSFLTLRAQQTTASVNVSAIEIYAPSLKTAKQIRVYLPKNYNKAQARYPVIYMHDAQNLFDRYTSFSGEWKADEALDSLRAEAIIIGIDHGADKRLEELTPYPNPKHGGGRADAYLDFIVNTLKPHVDSLYRTIKDKEHTTIMGSSLGGLVSLYAALKYPAVFGKAGIFSPSLWFTDDIFKMVEASGPIETKIYMMCGDSESEEMIPDVERMKNLLLKKMPGKNLVIKFVKGGKHNEELWSKEFPEAYLWLNKN